MTEMMTFYYICTMKGESPVQIPKPRIEQAGTGYVVFDKGMTAIIKGVAILLMLMLHCYHADDYDVALDLRYSLSGVESVFKICVGIYVFMVGYGYAFSKTKDWHYGWAHIRRLLLPFWVILFALTLPFCFSEVAADHVKTLVYNLVGIDSHYNWYSWFVYFFIYAMVVMPLLSRFVDRSPLRNTLIVVVCAAVLSVGVHEAPRLVSRLFGMQLEPVTKIRPIMALFNCLMMTPGMILGYLFAHEGYYERLRIDKLPAWLTAVAGLAVIAVTLIVRHVAVIPHNPFQMDFFYAPIIIGAIALLFSRFRWTVARRVLAKLGELSVYMWFVHALFFTTPVRWFYQPAITLGGNLNINLVVLWAIVLTTFISWLLKMLVDAVTRLVVDK